MNGKVWMRGVRVTQYFRKVFAEQRIPFRWQKLSFSDNFSSGQPATWMNKLRMNYDDIVGVLLDYVGGDGTSSEWQMDIMQVGKSFFSPLLLLYVEAELLSCWADDHDFMLCFQISFTLLPHTHKKMIEWMNCKNFVVSAFRRRSEMSCAAGWCAVNCRHVLDALLTVVDSAGGRLFAHMRNIVNSLMSVIFNILFGRDEVRKRKNSRQNW